MGKHVSLNLLSRNDTLCLCTYLLHAWPGDAMIMSLANVYYLLK